MFDETGNEIKRDKSVQGKLSDNEPSQRFDLVAAAPNSIPLAAQFSRNRLLRFANSSKVHIHSTFHNSLFYGERYTFHETIIA